MIDLEACARSLVAHGKGLLAADEDAETVDARLIAAGGTGGEKSRHDYRDLFLNTPGIEEFVSGISLSGDLVAPFAKSLHDRDIVAGVKVDQGIEPMAEGSQEYVTKGLLGLSERLTTDRLTYHTGFAKWRAVIAIHGDHLPSATCVVENAKRLGVFAKHVQETGMVPIVETEILYNGTHSRLRAAQVLEDTLSALMHSLTDQSLDLSGIILQSSMVLSGKDTGHHDTPEEVAASTIEALQKAVPKNVLGVVFLSGGQTPDQVTDNLRAIVQEGKKQHVSWPLSFSFARALQEEGLAVWGGKKENVEAAREAFLVRLRKVAAASRGE